MIISSISWLKPVTEPLAASMARGDLAQSMLIHGPRGTGRRHLAMWLASRLLEVPEPADPLAAFDAADGDGSTSAFGHPDCLVVSPGQEKRTITIAQVRDIIGFLQLRSHRGGKRVVVLYPAGSMTVSAANGLLKTLEEPPEGATIVLVADAPGQLPATIVSRCLRLRVALPQRGTALAWLRRMESDADWELLLEFAAGSPLLAQELQQRGLHNLAQRCRDELGLVRAGRETPTAIARRWVAGDTDLVLSWLQSVAASSITAAAARTKSVAATSKALQYSPKAPNMAALFSRLRAVEDLRRNLSRGLNLELQLADVLGRWYFESNG